MDPLPEVLESARWVVERAGAVVIDAAAMQRWVETLATQVITAPSAPPELRFTGSRDDSANLVLLLDCLNFCFWSDVPWSVEFRGRTWTRTYAMYASVLRAVERDPGFLRADRWASADTRDVGELFRGQGQIPLLDRRREVLNETGRRLVESFDGRFAHAVDQADRHARRLAYLLADEFPSFRDAPAYRGRTVAILKRAQICAADLHHCWTPQGYAGLAGLDELTVFADYRLPQYLRHVGILALAPDLAARIDAGEELAAGSNAEIELRAATIVAAELILEALRKHGRHLAAWELDFVLWERSHNPEVTVPHHRTRTIYY